jgi:RNA polymerase sigma factor (TIGR02999 family)
VDGARRKHSLKRGGRGQCVRLEEALSLTQEPADDLLALDEALTRLAQEDPVKAELVKLRYFAGLSVEQTALALGISRATADRYWAYAKVWLYHAVTGGDEPATG